MKYILAILILSSCASDELRKDQVHNIASVSYYTGCMDGADRMSYRHVVCYNKVKTFMNDIKYYEYNEVK